MTGPVTITPWGRVIVVIAALVVVGGITFAALGFEWMRDVNRAATMSAVGPAPSDVERARIARRALYDAYLLNGEAEIPAIAQRHNVTEQAVRDASAEGRREGWDVGDGSPIMKHRKVPR
jgi:hypothetical protein